MHPSDPDTTYAAGTPFTTDSASVTDTADVPCHDPAAEAAARAAYRGSTSQELSRRMADNFAREVGLAVPAAVATDPDAEPPVSFGGGVIHFPDDDKPAPDPPPPQSAAEAGRHCLHLLELTLPEHLVANVWAAVEALENAARLEARDACANVADDWGWSNKPDHAHGIARAIRALPLGVPR